MKCNWSSFCTLVFMNCCLVAALVVLQSGRNKNEVVKETMHTPAFQQGGGNNPPLAKCVGLSFLKINFKNILFSSPQSFSSPLLACFHFCVFKGISEKYKGKYDIEAYLLSFPHGRSNQFNSFTRLLHLYCFLNRHPYQLPSKPYSHMAIRPYCHILVIWPYQLYDNMASNMVNMGVCEESDKNLAIWRRI